MAGTPQHRDASPRAGGHHVQDASPRAVRVRSESPATPPLAHGSPSAARGGPPPPARALDPAARPFASAAAEPGVGRSPAELVLSSCEEPPLVCPDTPPHRQYVVTRSAPAPGDTPPHSSADSAGDDAPRGGGGGGHDGGAKRPPARGSVLPGQTPPMQAPPLGFGGLGRSDSEERRRSPRAHAGSEHSDALGAGSSRPATRQSSAGDAPGGDPPQADGADAPHGGADGSPLSPQQVDLYRLRMYPPFVGVIGGINNPACHRPVACVPLKAWIKDEDCAACQQCSVLFTFTVRKHHCRVCGRIFCGNCSSRFLPATGDGGEVRVCDACHGEHLQPIRLRSVHRDPKHRRRGRLNHIENKVVARVLQFLPLARVLGTLGGSCRDLYMIARGNLLWRAFFRRRWPGLAQQAAPPAPGESHFYFHFYHQYQQRLDLERRTVHSRVCARLSDTFCRAPVRIAVLGPPGVGKTALVSRFLTGSALPLRGPTAGACVRHRCFRPKPIKPDRRLPCYQEISLGPNTLQIIDCGGDMRYGSLLPIYLQGIHAAIVCLPQQSTAGADDPDLVSSLEVATRHCPPDCPVAACRLRSQDAATPLADDAFVLDFPTSHLRAWAVRRAPDRRAELLWTLDSGAALTFNRRQGGFLRMSDGWVKAQDGPASWRPVELGQANTPVVCSVYRLIAPPGRRWPVRVSPSDQSDVLWTVGSETKLGFSEQRNGYYRIASGWCVESLLGGGWKPVSARGGEGRTPRAAPRARPMSPGDQSPPPVQPERPHPRVGGRVLDADPWGGHGVRALFNDVLQQLADRVLRTRHLPPTQPSPPTALDILLQTA